MIKYLIKLIIFSNFLNNNLIDKLWIVKLLMYIFCLYFIKKILIELNDKFKRFYEIKYII